MALTAAVKLAAIGSIPAELTAILIGMALGVGSAPPVWGRAARSRLSTNVMTTNPMTSDLVPSDSRAELLRTVTRLAIWSKPVKLGLIVVMGLFVHPLVAVGATVAIGVQPYLSRKVAAQKEEADRLDALPLTLDLLAVVLGSGGTISHGVQVVAVRGNSSIRPVFERMLIERKAGQPLVLALSRAGDRLGEAYRPLLRALVSTERDGAPIASLLMRLAEEAETSRRSSAEARAKRLSVQLLLPLVVCFLPAVIVGAIVPLVVVAAGRFL